MKDKNDAGVTIVQVDSMAAIKEEERFLELNKLGFVRAENADDQWRLLVNEAWQKSKLPENEIIANYLSKMLHDYMNDETLYHRLAQFNFAMYLLKAEAIDERCVKDVADISLQYLAFVPDRHLDRRETRSLSYSAWLCESFYKHLAMVTHGQNSWESKAYQELSKSYGLAVMVLRSVKRPFNQIDTKADGSCFPDDKQAAEVAKMCLLTAKSPVTIN